MLKSSTNRPSATATRSSSLGHWPLSTSARIELIIKNAEHYRVVNIDYHEGLRYPHLERDAAGAPALLEEILAARK